jgi:hypothetical protein
MGSGIILALLPLALVLGKVLLGHHAHDYPKLFCTYTDTCQGMCGRKRRGEVLAGRRSSSHGYHTESLSYT